MSEFLRRAVIERPLAAFLVIMFIAAGVSAAVLFNQTLTGPSPVGAVMSKNCDTAPPAPPTYIVGTSGFVTWGCTTTQSAIRVNSAGTVTPTITKGAEWTTTYIWKTSGTAPSANCASASITKLLASGTAVSFVTGEIGDWNYCSDYVNAPSTMSNVVYSWNQA